MKFSHEHPMRTQTHEQRQTSMHQLYEPSSSQSKSAPKPSHLVLPIITIDHDDGYENQPGSLRSFPTDKKINFESGTGLNRHRGTSKSFNEKSLLTIPKRIYRHQRSKSEKSRSNKSMNPSVTNQSVSTLNREKLPVSGFSIYYVRK